MPASNIDRLATSRENLRELILPPTVDFPEAAITGNPEFRRQAVREFNRRRAERDKIVQERLLAWLQITSDT